VIVLVGLFSRTPKDPQSKKNEEQFKKFKKLVKEKKYPEALKLGTDYLEKVPVHHDVLFTIGGIYGKITDVKEDAFVIEVHGGTKLKVAKTAVSMTGDAGIEQK
jgi:hypothetical protein